MVALSVVVITYNEEKNLGRCLASVKDVADEIVVVDSNSKDNTVAIAEKFGAKVIQHDFDGYGQQKNFATDSAANDWVLNLDADEELTGELIQSILKFKQQPTHDVYEMPRLTNYCGKWIKHCGWYPDRQTRLYNRTKGRWVERRVHESWEPSLAQKKGLLKGDLLHYSFSSIAEHIQKIDKYSQLAAMAAVENGKSASLFTLIFSPFWHFVNEYFIRLGFLDGYYGYVICRLSAFATFQKYARIRYNKEHGIGIK